MTKPSPALLTIRLAINPAMRPRISHAYYRTRRFSIEVGVSFLALIEIGCVSIYSTREQSRHETI